MADEEMERETMDDGFVNKPELMLELENLCKCYELASRDDKNVVWAALNKYMPSVMNL